MGAEVVVEQIDLLAGPTASVILSANNNLRASATRWSWSQEVETRAGAAYVAECERIARAAGTEGLAQGTAAATSAAGLTSRGGPTLVLQAVTIRYDRHGQRHGASPEVVYAATRAALEKAEIFGADSVATYLMGIRPGYSAGASTDSLADAHCLALLDHAAISRMIRRIAIRESDPRRVGLATAALARCSAIRLSAG